MKGIIAFMFFMLFLAGLAFIMLKDMGAPDAPAAAPQNDAATIIVSGDWRPIKGAETFVRFQNDGKLIGFAGCNSFFGSYVATDNTIEPGPIGSTRMACPDDVMAAEQKFLAALQSATSYRIVADELILTGEGRSGLRLVLTAPGDPEKEE